MARNAKLNKNVMSCALYSNTFEGLLTGALKEYKFHKYSRLLGGVFQNKGG